MGDREDIKLLLHKYIKGQCTADEATRVVRYFKANRITDDFPGVEDLAELQKDAPQMSPLTSDAIFSAVIGKAKEQENAPATTHFDYKKYMAIAACFLLLMGGGWLYQANFSAPEKEPLKLTGNEITLQLENGDIQVISENGQQQLMDASGNLIASQEGANIVYGAANDLEKLVYNTLKIPYGKRFKLQLSDGTVVHLNAGTTLKYPVKFIAGESRKVFLNGEAYFDVAKDARHPFVVNADELNVRVLGTHFNVSGYPEDDLTDVVLVEGSVGLYKSGEQFSAKQSTILKPGFKASFNKSNGSLATKAVATSVHTAWVHGELNFRNLSFKNISRKLERHYDIEIENHNPQLETVFFNASFRDEPIEKILSYFNEAHGFKYKIQGKKIIIN